MALDTVAPPPPRGGLGRVEASGAYRSGASALELFRAGGYTYKPRRPQDETLYEVVRENLQTLYAAVDEGFAGAGLPSFVRNELESYLECGLHCRGFAYIGCRFKECPNKHLVAFSCGGRGFCPSCLGRRMAQTSANLVDHVLPEAPLRQHGLFLDGVYVLGPDGDAAESPKGGVPVFQTLSRLSTSDVADILQIVEVRILRFLKRRGVIEIEPEATVIDEDLAEREPAMAALAAAAVSGLPPAGPVIRRRPPIDVKLRGRPDFTVKKPLCVEYGGFSLHAASRAGAWDDRARQALIEYILRPPIANERLQPGPDGLVRVVLKRPFSDGTTALDLDPLSLLCRLAAMPGSPASLLAEVEWCLPHAFILSATPEFWHRHLRGDRW